MDASPKVPPWHHITIVPRVDISRLAKALPDQQQPQREEGKEHRDRPPIVLSALVPKQRAWSLRRRRIARSGLAAAPTLIGYIVHLSRNLEHRARVIGATKVVVVYIQHVWWSVVCGNARIGCETQAAVAGDVVGLVELRDVGHEQASAEDGERGVEVVVGEVQAILCVCHRQSVRPLDGAGEALVGWIEGRLPHVAELVDPPWIGRLISLIVQEHDDARVVDYHFGQCGPGGNIHGLIGRRVDVVQYAGLVDVGCIEGRI